ncbi:VRR-NUC domain-containing protein [Antarcticirhabdus aurantiaca]|uniref:VRR-NUC domain-containing protein n=1 Tax=Antarcticirhabdus aurantiaca TaxID=2606717 RepID=UPI00131D549C|nr:VRR-NUC domain-containing protein [Antarcticirhabdus aurantiaca]
MTAAGKRLIQAAREAREIVSHLAIYDFLVLVLPSSYRVHHSPNGGKRSEKEGAKLKRQGTQPGWPDIEIVGPTGRLFFIEVKRLVGGALSPEQIDLRDWCDANGVPWALCRTIDDVMAALAAWQIPTRQAA